MPYLVVRKQVLNKSYFTNVALFFKEFVETSNYLHKKVYIKC